MAETFQNFLFRNGDACPPVQEQKCKENIIENWTPLVKDTKKEIQGMSQLNAQKIDFNLLRV